MAEEQKSQVPEGFIPDTPDVPEGFIPDAPAPVKGQPPDPRTAGQVAEDQAANVLKGIPQAITGIPGAVKSTYEALRDIVMNRDFGKAGQLAYGTVQPAIPLAKTLIGQAPPPDSPEWSQAAQGAGAMLGTGLTGMAGEAIAPKVSSMLESAALKQYTRALAPSTAELKQRAMRTVPEMISRGVTGSLEDLRDRADSMVDKVGKQREAALETARQTQINVQPTLNAIDKSLRDNRIVIDDPATGQPKVMNQAVANSANKLKQSITQFGTDLSAETLDKVKQYWQGVVAESGGYTGRPNLGLSRNVMRDAASSLSEELHKASPDIAKIDAEYTVWRNLQQVVDSTLQRRVGQPGIGIRDVASVAMGGGLGYLTHGLGGTSAGMALMGTLALAMKSPAWKTVSAITKDRLAGLLANGDLRTAALLSTRLTNTSSGAQSPSQ